MIDFNAFSHGQIQSKLWLCENLEPLLPDDTNVLILGAWYGILNFMMLTRNQKNYNLITGIDKNESSVEVSNKILDAWSLGVRAISKSELKDIDNMENIFGMYDVVINCSCEHMSNQWYDKVKENQLMCIQTSNVTNDDPIWDVTNPNSTIDEFKAKYPMSQILFEGEKIFDYGHLRYSRYMLIGKK